MAITSKNYFKQILLVSAFSFMASACMYTPPVDQGKHFSDQQVHRLKLHMAKGDVKKILGEPVMQHHNDSQWTYIDYHYTQDHQTRLQLMLSFNKKDRLTKVISRKKHTS